ncbi:methyltransferase-like protein [Lasiosphaeria miniovina]|uniref:Histone-lysine N-methyltransferase, H3 lysine-36 specific n=1 Tax=Lasiosphaeria miniovina TaxID=1954250 RepID=A0AA40AUY8_9PEZI|nr:methyltransferase-like protein [Lasiosphaeria miniovina]KAK0722500.1 methyltransferase-like protein [Lasiosphaeria miniovina]
MDEDGRAQSTVGGIKSEERLKTNGVKQKKDDTSLTATPNDSKINSRVSSMSPDDAKSASGSASTPENGTAPKLSRKSSQKTIRTLPPLYGNLPDVTNDACATFQVIPDCIWGTRHMGSSEHDALDCDCAEDWRNDQNHACGEESDCINRATKMECVDRECNCGNGCQNQRFQRKQYADVSVIKTDKKGFGLRANVDLQPHDFVFEYIGEVINEANFHRRMRAYDNEGIKHFYFMSLTKSEFVDATKKGNLGRFCNHSCNPNCYVDKWVVGEKLRMGIFALHPIRAGEELVFNYNVDRYGADPQPCYCGEPNCVGFIGGKTQTERATKLAQATIEALGIDDGDNWDTAVAKKPRKKKATEDDEDFVNSIQPRLLDEESVNKVMATLMQCKEKWIAVKLLARLQAADDDHLRHRVVKMHGYQILKTALNTFKDDNNVVLQILDILYKLPRITKNKISDSNIEATIQGLASSDHQDVAFESKRLLDEWSKLETAYRIPRKKADSTAPVTINSFEEERRNMDREEISKPVNHFANMVVPTGPRSTIPQRNAGFFNGQRPPRKLPTNLPLGWFVTTDKSGRYYFYDKSGNTTWQRPTAPAVEVPKASSKVNQDQKTLQDIIDSLTKEPTPRHSANHTPQQASTPAPESKRERWRSLPVEKQMKIYENTLFPHVKYVMDKFHHKLPKDDLKKFAREVNKKLVASDYKNHRVEDPTSITPKQEKKVKKYVYSFFERALVKYKEHEKKKASEASGKITGAVAESKQDEANNAASTPPKDDAALSDAEDASTPDTSPGRKRKREDDLESMGETPSETPSLKRVKEDDSGMPSPPPPPPPPTDTPITETDEERSMREQEEALMRENEEAQRLEDEAEQTHRKTHDGSLAANAHVGPRGPKDKKNDGAHSCGPSGGLKVTKGSMMDIDVDGLTAAAGGSDNNDNPLEHKEVHKQEVLSH